MARISLIEEKTTRRSPPLIGQDQGGAAGRAAQCLQAAAALPVPRRNLARPCRRSALEDRAQRPVARASGDPHRVRQRHSPMCSTKHVPALALAEGVTLAECDALKDWRTSDSVRRGRARRDRLCGRDGALQTSVPDDVFAELKRHYDERAIVEISVLIGTYLMHNRVMGALKIDLEQDSERGR